ncbi:MAG TPA: Uma2 family endonuclease [Anaerolineales bacterium]|nr:Uma2 family endonuclease [Anaerolineales bacterium]
MTANAPSTEVAAERLYTGEEVLALGDIGPYELVEGRIIPMSPTKHKHGRYEITFATILNNFVKQNRLGEVQGGEVGIYVRRNPDTVRAADVLFISNERLAKANPDGFLDVAPELVVEIVSPDDRWTEIRQKIREYFSAGVNVVLVIDPSERTVTIYRSLTHLRELTVNDILTLEDILPGFSVPVVELFS